MRCIVSEQATSFWRTRHCGKSRIHSESDWSESVLYSNISPSILSYVLNLNKCAEIWVTREKILQSSNRTLILQVKNELHNLTMGSKIMARYLSYIKSKVDLIKIEDIIYYPLNNLPSSYQSFKVSTQTNLQPISLNDLYSLLCSTEKNTNSWSDIVRIQHSKPL